MSDGRKRFSGSQYAKLRKEKEDNSKKDIESSKKIDDFFRRRNKNQTIEFEEKHSPNKNNSVTE